jgi:uncharacterized protein (TIGR02246 family)
VEANLLTSFVNTPAGLVAAGFFPKNDRPVLNEPKQRSMKSRPIAIVAINYVLISTALAADTAEKSTSPETTAITNQAAQYTKAYNAADAKALAKFFTEDVEYTDENGQFTQGRSDIEDLLKKTFEQNKGAKLDVEVDSVRPLAPDVIEEKGTTTVTSSNGEKQSSDYTAIHVKKDGEWLISRLYEFQIPDPTAGQQLSELAWMIGTWKDKGGGSAVETKADWARGNNFLTRTFKVSQGGDVTLEGWQIIGWDPIEKRIRSWIFDSDGGYGQAFWTRDGNRWLLKETRVSAEGSESSAEQTLTYVNPDHCTFESVNRTLDGDPQPNIDKIEIDRVKTQ